MYHQTAVWVVFLLAFSVIRETSTFSAGIGNLGLEGKRELPSFKTRRELKAVCDYVRRSSMSKGTGRRTPLYIRGICDL
ncbi:hypothetical protein P5673_005323 [Acropora cervicornis]|uniref:Uncharacterized protein n=1 Tax=Acropora cervicornis TaxID=6130 RepID=A0AAD9QY12_ACRCE|nr:hypothetical protein P5673_005323 [Acropora cervicornis]